MNINKLNFNGFILSTTKIVITEIFPQKIFSGRDHICRLFVDPKIKISPKVHETRLTVRLRLGECAHILVIFPTFQRSDVRVAWAKFVKLS